MAGAMTDPTPLGTGPADPTGPAEGLDPRVEAAVKVIGPTLHGWHDGFAEGECPECQEVTRDALAAADAVDPLRAAWGQTGQADD